MVREGLRVRGLRAKCNRLQMGLLQGLCVVKARTIQACWHAFEPERCFAATQSLCESWHCRSAPSLLHKLLVLGFCKKPLKCRMVGCRFLHATIAAYRQVRALAYYRTAGSPDYRDLVTSIDLDEALHRWAACYQNIKQRLTRDERYDYNDLVLLLAWEQEVVRQRTVTNAEKKAQRAAQKAAAAQGKGGGRGASAE